MDMKRYVLSNLDDLDFNARELAALAAQKAGLSLEEWIASTLSGQDEQGPPPQAIKPQENGFGAIVDRLAKTARPQPAKDYDALMATIAESEHQTQDKNSCANVTLQSIAGWMEQTEERLAETTRATTDHQDRMTTALTHALSTLKERLDSVEQQAVTEQQDTASVSDALTGLRKDMSRLAERMDKPDATWMPAIGNIRIEIERLRSSLEALATREEVSALDQAMKDIVREIGQSSPSKDLLVLAQSTAALYRQVQVLSDDITEGLHGRISGEIDILKAKIDKIAEAGIDRTVIEFLGSQILDMRQDLANRAEPRQIERLSEEVGSLGRQIADMRLHQVGRADFVALKSSLENVCAALSSKAVPEPTDLTPITDQLAVLTEKMGNLSGNRLEQADTLAEMIGRLSLQMQAVAEKDELSHEPLLRRFDRIEQGLQDVGQRATTAKVEEMLRSIDEKLDRAPAQQLELDALERQIVSLAERLGEHSDGPLRKTLNDATDNLHTIQSKAIEIAERAARAAVKEIQPNLPDAGDLDTLKQGFVELKALQTWSDKKTQETLRAVNSALETLVSRFPEQSAIAHRVDTSMQTLPEEMPPADRLEVAVRRLHTAALSQVEEVSSDRQALETKPVVEMSVAPEDAILPHALNSETADDAADLDIMRSSFIVAARRAAQATTQESAAPVFQDKPKAAKTSIDFDDQFQVVTAPSLIERIRRRFDAHRAPLLVGIGVLILVAGAAQILSGGLDKAPIELSVSEAPQAAPVSKSKEQVPEQTGSVTPPSEKATLFQSATMTATVAPFLPPGSGKFHIDPATVGEIPTQIPAALRKAATTGDAAALYEIASLAAEGRGLPRDMILAMHLFERAAQAGLPPAQERLGSLYEKGIGTNRDLKRAITWYERAAQGGNIRAMHNLATLLTSSVNGKPDYPAALRWYNEAAEAGLRDSQFNMGVLLIRGVGANQDMLKAYQWFALAAAQGDPEASKKRDELTKRLNAAELAAAKASVDQWRARPFDPTANSNEFPPFSAGQVASLD
jgi:localization factor PodJL